MATRRRSHLDKESAAKLSAKPLLSRPAPRHSLTWHWIGSDGDPWPEWLRAYKDACGVYAIRENGKVVYVGSSKKRVYDTLTRHFQTWKRTAKGRRASKYNYHRTHETDHDPGMVYKREKCQIAVYTVACGAELEEEARLIAKYQPRDNIMENPDGLEDAPF